MVWIAYADEIPAQIKEALPPDHEIRQHEIFPGTNQRSCRFKTLVNSQPAGADSLLDQRARAFLKPRDVTAIGRGNVQLQRNSFVPFWTHSNERIGVLVNLGVPVGKRKPVGAVVIARRVIIDSGG